MRLISSSLQSNRNTGTAQISLMRSEFARGPMLGAGAYGLRKKMEVIVTLRRETPSGRLTSYFSTVVVRRFLRFGLAGILGVLQLNVCVKRFIDHFIGFLLRILCTIHRLFDTDDLIALRALAEEMTGAVHFVLWSKPRYVDQFRCCHDCLPFHSSTWCVYPWGERYFHMPDPDELAVVRAPDLEVIQQLHELILSRRSLRRYSTFFRARSFRNGVPGIKQHLGTRRD
jgi:hypothetical protein